MVERGWQCCGVVHHVSGRRRHGAQGGEDGDDAVGQAMCVMGAVGAAQRYSGDDGGSSGVGWE